MDDMKIFDPRLVYRYHQIAKDMNRQNQELLSMVKSLTTLVEDNCVRLEVLKKRLDTLEEELGL